MANLSLKNVPADLHRKLKQRAREHHRSLNGEIIASLQEAVAPRRFDAEEAARRLRELRARYRGRPPSERQVAALKSEGRP
jgi:plasmid stability protein